AASAAQRRRGSRDRYTTLRACARVPGAVQRATLLLIAIDVARGALQTRDRRESSAWNSPGSAAHHSALARFTLRCARDTGTMSPRVSQRAGAGVGRRMRGELAVELAEHGDAVGEAILGAGGGEDGVLRRGGAVDDEARAGERLEQRGQGRIAHPVVRPGEA